MNTKPVGGRPTKKTPATRETFLAAIKKGLPRSEACRLASISQETMRDWFREDPDLMEETDRTEAEVTADLIERLHQLGSDDPKVLQWLIERRCPREFGSGKAFTPQEAPRNSWQKDGTVEKIIEGLRAKGLLDA